MKDIRTGPRRAALAVRKTVRSSKRTLQQVREVADPRTIAAGFAGLSAGEAAGGAVGGLVGIVVAGAPGAVVGGQIGAFSGGMIGLKIGTETIEYYLRAKKDALVGETVALRPVDVVNFLRTKGGERVGEIAGLTSGAAVGIVVAGPVGGLMGAIIGEAVGGQLGEDIVRNKSTQGGLTPDGTSVSVARWMESLGRTTAGEGAAVLIGGTVGSVFGSGGRAIGQRLGIIVGKRVNWQKANSERLDASVSEQWVSGPGERPIQNDDSDQAVEFSDISAATELSSRELEVLALYTAGLTEDETAVLLSIRPATVKRYRSNIRRKLGVQDLAEISETAVFFLPLMVSDESV